MGVGVFVLFKNKKIRVVDYSISHVLTVWILEIQKNYWSSMKMKMEKCSSKLQYPLPF